MSHKHHKSAILPGRVGSSTLLYGSLGVIVAGVLYWIGLLGKGDQGVLDLILQSIFRGALPAEFGFPVLVSITTIFCYGIAFAVLDSAGTWRRVLLGLTVIILIVALVPTLALWEIYFPPMMSLVGVFWTWFISIIYANHHQMPCDHITFHSEESYIAEMVSQPVIGAERVVEEFPSVEMVKKPLDEDAKYKPSEE